MSATALDRMAKPSDALSRPASLVLVRIAAGGGTAATIARDLKCISAEVAGSMDGLVADLMRAGLVTDAGGNGLVASADGQSAAAAVLGLRKAKALHEAWPQVRDGLLVQRALSLETAGAKVHKSTAKIDGLRLAIVAKAWGLKPRGKASPSRARTALALLALERAFGNSVKGALGAKTDLSPKASRLLAAQLSKTPKDYGTDARLVAALAAEVVGAAKADLASLRAGVVRRFLLDEATPKRPERRKRAIVPVAEAPVPVPAPAQSAIPSVVEPVADASRALAAPSTHPEPAPTLQLIASRPDPAQFASAVLAAAAGCAEGWPGNRRAFVSQVWVRVRALHPLWQLSQIEFKSMLTEAHRKGLLTLANADLKDKSRLPDLQASAISYKNTVWHYVRVEG